MTVYDNNDLPIEDKETDAGESIHTSNSLNKDDNDKVTHGVVYIPNSECGEYVCEHYSVSSNNNERKSAQAFYNTKQDVVSSKPKFPFRTLGIIAIAVALCVFFSSLAAFGVTMLTRSMISDYDVPPENTSKNADKIKPDNNHVFVDRDEHPYLEQQVSPGELMSMEAAIESVKDSVVEITTETVKSGFGGFSQYVVSGAGSGVIISTGGYIITNNHVIEGASNITVRLTDGSEYTAELIGTDSQTDIAVISIIPDEGVELVSAIIGQSDSLKLGQTVIAIGNPLGELGGTVTDGIISSLEREVAMDGSGTMTLLQTNAAVSPGNSGGGLFDLYGRLIGVVNAKSTGEGIEGISFAIPINTAWDIAQQLIDKGYVSGRPALGIELKQVQYALSVFGDVYYQVVVNKDYEDIGLKSNDIIVSIDNVSVSTLNEILNVVGSHRIGDEVVVRIRRDRRQFEVKVPIVEYVPANKDTD